MKRLQGGRASWITLLALAACGARPLAEAGDSGGASDARVTALHFTTTSEFPENPPPTNVDVTLTDPARARAIYDATLALPAFPEGRIHCPNDPGYRHSIVFSSGSAVIVSATFAEWGCRDAQIAGMPPVRQTSDAYWNLVAQNLGVDEASLFSTIEP